MTCQDRPRLVDVSTLEWWIPDLLKPQNVQSRCMSKYLYQKFDGKSLDKVGHRMITDGEGVLEINLR